jgi:hypothetical protein
LPLSRVRKAFRDGGNDPPSGAGQLPPSGSPLRAPATGRCAIPFYPLYGGLIDSIPLFYFAPSPARLPQGGQVPLPRSLFLFTPTFVTFWKRGARSNRPLSAFAQIHPLGPLFRKHHFWLGGSNLPDSVRPRTSKGITDLLLPQTSHWLDANSPSKMLPAMPKHCVTS